MDICVHPLIYIIMNIIINTSVVDTSCSRRWPSTPLSATSHAQFRETDPAVVRQLDTTQSVGTADRVASSGGMIDRPGPVVAGGTPVVNSGYEAFGQIPGNPFSPGSWPAGHLTAVARSVP